MELEAYCICQELRRNFGIASSKRYPVIAAPSGTIWRTSIIPTQTERTTGRNIFPVVNHAELAVVMTLIRSDRSALCTDEHHKGLLSLPPTHPSTPYPELRADGRSES